MPNIYNVIASLCSQVLKTCKEDFFVRYSCIVGAEKQRIGQLVHSELGLQLEAGSAARQLKPEDLTEPFFQSLDRLSKSLLERGDYSALVGLIQFLDESLVDILAKDFKVLQSERFSVVLNTNRESTGLGLLPRCSCAWERKHRLSHSYNRLDNFLFNMLLIDNSILGDLVDMHFFLKDGMFPRFAGSKSLKIAVTPLRLEKNFRSRPYESNQVHYFNIDYAKTDMDLDNERVWQKIVAASEKESDIVVFPEMLGNPTMVEFVSRKIKEAPAELQGKIPSLMVLPSYWDGGRNAAVVLDHKGNVLCRQNKQNPFRMERGGQGYLEGIVSNKVVNILHYEGIGRIAILICKDFLTTHYMEQIMRCFKLTLIIVPSFSTGSYDFRQSFDLCAHDDCNVVWINTCAALQKGKESNFENVGYVRKRISRSDDEAQMLCRMPICKGAFKGECNHDCIYYETIQGV